MTTVAAAACSLAAVGFYMLYPPPKKASVLSTHQTITPDYYPELCCIKLHLFRWLVQSTRHKITEKSFARSCVFLEELPVYEVGRELPRGLFPDDLYCPIRCVCYFQLSCSYQKNVHPPTSNTLYTPTLLLFLLLYITQFSSLSMCGEW